MSCQETRQNIAVALLTGSPLDAMDAEHVAICEECSREFEELRPVVDLLVLAPSPSNPSITDEAMLRGLLSRVSAERRQHRRTLSLGAVAAAVLLLIVPVVTLLVLNVGSNPPTTVPQVAASTSATQGPIRGSAQVIPASAGSRVVVSVSGVTPGTRCSLVLVDHSGTRSVVESWEAEYRGKATVSTHTTVATSDVGQLQLVNADDASVLLNFDFTT
jgi:hypothetical protein